MPGPGSQLVFGGTGSSNGTPSHRLEVHSRPADGTPNQAERAARAVAPGYVAVILSEQSVPRLVDIAAADVDAPAVRLAGKDHVDAGAGDWLGFYDWLRDRAGRVIGVQQWLFEPSTYPFAKAFAGVDADSHSGCVRIFFGQSRDVDEAASCDQDFGSNRLLVANDSIALTFNAPDPTAGDPGVSVPVIPSSNP